MATLQDFQKNAAKSTSKPSSRAATASRRASPQPAATPPPANSKKPATKKARKPSAEEHLSGAASGSAALAPKAGLVSSRRPYREKLDHPSNSEEKNMQSEQSPMESESTSQDSGMHHQESHSDPKKVEISFVGSEILRAKWKKPFDVAEKVATDWVNGGNFENLEIGNPLADSLATRGLQKAKEVEKQVLESPAFEKVATRALTWGLKVHQEVQNIRSQVKSRLGK